LGFEQYGVWLVLSTVLTMAQLGNLGLTQAVTKFMAAAHAKRDEGEVRAYFSSAVAVLAVLGLLVAALLTMLAAPIASAFALDPQNTRLFVRNAPYVSLLSGYVIIVQAALGGLAGVGRTDHVNYAQFGGRVIAVLASALGLWRGHGVGALVGGYALSNLFIHVTSSYLLRREVQGATLSLSGVSIKHIADLLRFGGGVFGGSLLNLLFQPVNRLVLARYSGVDQLPILEIGYAGSMQVRSIFETGLRAVMPEVSGIGAGEAAGRRLGHLMRRCGVFVYGVALPTYVGLAVIAAPVLRAWLRLRFTETQVPVFRVMLAASFLSLVGVPAYYLALGMGRVRTTAVASGVQFTVSLAMSLLVVALTGGIGPTAISVSVCVGFGCSTALLLRAQRDLVGAQRLGFLVT
jgi:O-antigen/teichoic acid export membrane protein